MGDGISGTMALTQGMLDDLIYGQGPPPHTHTQLNEWTMALNLLL